MDIFRKEVSHILYELLVGKELFDTHGCAEIRLAVLVCQFLLGKIWIPEWEEKEGAKSTNVFSLLALESEASWGPFLSRDRPHVIICGLIIFPPPL